MLIGQTTHQIANSIAKADALISNYVGHGLNMRDRASIVEVFRLIAPAKTSTLRDAVIIFVRRSENAHKGIHEWPALCNAYFTIYSLNRFVFDVPSDQPSFFTVSHWDGKGAPFPWKYIKGRLSFQGSPLGPMNVWPNMINEFNQFSLHNHRRRIY